LEHIGADLESDEPELIGPMPMSDALDDLASQFESSGALTAFLHRQHGPSVCIRK
jgi:hypothetical protein